MNKVNVLQWFIDRIGKKIYRINNSCSCPICIHTYENGLIVDDKFHALYLFDCQNEMGLIYVDKKGGQDE